MRTLPIAVLTLMLVAFIHGMPTGKNETIYPASSIPVSIH